MNDTITRAEHEALCKWMESENKRLSDEDNRQNKRLDMIESSIRETAALAASVERLATNMEGMLKEQERQGKRLETLEGRDGAKWRAVMGYIATALISGAVAFIFARIGG